MGTSNPAALLEGLILIEDGANAARDRLVRDNGRVRKTIVFVSEPAEGPGVAVELVDQGVELIELDGGFGSLGGSTDGQRFGADDRPRRAAIVTRSGSESAFILRMT
jgi:hypothetical protein